ncbi:protein phosphatase 1 regulatory subunit 12A [Aplysia californica]|uniref:Protein phosphatase 1 regulatory subunit 12A n=1 Tax=Aplysia californica TaxID=6500 RepID=A0ABM1W086_APLCA|nr:protein phosphatase 1 regulatory subunit 12A [Aplysia californica]
MSSEIKRRISFSADSVLTAVVQDADTTELVRILDHHGDEIRVNQVNHVGLTALHHGVLSNNLDAVKLLLCNGADINAQDVHGFSPLHTAAACGFLQIASLLVLYGADVFSLTAQKETPLDVAKDIGVIRLLADEMRRHIHQELFLTSIVRSKAYDTWVLMCRCAVRCVDELLHVVMQLWRRHRTKEKVKLESSKTENGKKEE